MPNLLQRAKVFRNRREHKEAVRAQCLREYEDTHGRPWKQGRFTSKNIPKGEIDARAAFSEARRAMSALLAVVDSRGFEVQGACTAFLNARKDDLRELLSAPEWKKGRHWRQHTSDRLNSATTWTLTVFGAGQCLVRGEARALRSRELAVISILEGAIVRGTGTVADSIEHETQAIRVAQRRLKTRTRN